MRRYHSCMNEITFAAWLFYFKSDDPDWKTQCEYWRSRQLDHARAYIDAED